MFYLQYRGHQRYNEDNYPMSKLIHAENINIYYFDIINNLKNFGETLPTNAKITIELPEGVSKEEILKEIENLIMKQI